jgi:hypothetical protein
MPIGDVTCADAKVSGASGARPEGFVPKAMIDEFCHNHDMFCYHTSVCMNVCYVVMSFLSWHFIFVASGSCCATLSND